MRTLIETPTFDADIVVPQADDDRHDAAEVVAAIAQKTTNRTLYLKQVVEAFVIPDPPNLAPYARKDTANTFTAKQTLGADADVFGTLHASVDVTAQRDLNAVRNINAGNGNVSAKLVHSDTDVTSDRDVLAARDVIAGRNLVGTLVLGGADEIARTGTDAERTRYLNVPLASAAYGAFAGAPGYDVVYDKLGFDSATGETVFALPLELPRGAKLLHVDMAHYQHDTGSTGTDTQFYVYSRGSIDWDAVTTDTAEATHFRSLSDVAVASDNALSDYPTRYNQAIVTRIPTTHDSEFGDASGYTIADRTVWLRVTLRGANLIYAVRAAYVDPGPR